MATLLSVASCHWCCCYDVMLLWRRYVQFLPWCASSVSEINWNWNKAPSRGQNEPPSILEKNLGPPWKYLPWSEKVNYFELVELLVAKFDRRFSQPGMNKLFVTGRWREAQRRRCHREFEIVLFGRRWQNMILNLLKRFSDALLNDSVDFATCHIVID